MHVRHFFSRESSLEGTEICLGDAVRIRTRGDCLFIESIAKLEAETTSATVRNFSGGEQVGMSWTDKVMAVKNARDSQPEQSGASAQTGDCAAEDEWGDWETQIL